jgi:hypothetical protein
MAAAAMLEIQVNAIKWAITTRANTRLRPILMQIGTQTKKNMLSLKITVPEVRIKFQDGRRRHVGN